jgi:hypothetical protein
MKTGKLEAIETVLTSKAHDTLCSAYSASFGLWCAGYSLEGALKAQREASQQPLRS